MYIDYNKYNFKGKIVTISSSLKFKSEIKSIKNYLIKKGAIVHTPESWKDLFNKEPSKQELDQIVKNYDKMISKSDVLFVINKNNYIGDSVEHEIEVAKNIINGPDIIYYEPTIFVTLIGSEKFSKLFYDVQLTFISQKNIHYVILRPETFKVREKSVLSNEEWEKFHKLHQIKMDLADIIYVINPNGYIGPDTQREIEYCKSLKYDIHYFYKDDDPFNLIFKDLKDNLDMKGV